MKKKCVSSVQLNHSKHREIDFLKIAPDRTLNGLKEACSLTGKGEKKGKDYAWTIGLTSDVGEHENVEEQ